MDNDYEPEVTCPVCKGRGETPGPSRNFMEPDWFICRTCDGWGTIPEWFAARIREEATA